MFTRPDGLEDGDVVAALGDGWGLRVADGGLAYAAVGFGSYHWHAVDTAGAWWFVTADDLERRAQYERLHAALATTRALRDGGMAFVVAPVPTRARDVLHRVGERWAVALYPHVAGEAHTWGPYPSAAARLAVLDLLVALHAAPAAARATAEGDDLAIPRRAGLEAAIASVTRPDGAPEPWGPGPCAAPTRDLLARHAGALVAALDRHDALAAAAAARPERWVVTHGEPHRANTITTPDGPVLVDWESLRLAPPERDLWSLVVESPDVADRYAAATGTAVDARAVALYRLTWDLTDVANYVDLFRRPHADTEDTRTAWAALAATLDPARWR